MRLRLEDADGRTARWARRAGVAEAPLSPLLVGHADFGAPWRVASESDALDQTASPDLDPALTPVLTVNLRWPDAATPVHIVVPEMTSAVPCLV